jgi:hypothetical protein
LGRQEANQFVEPLWFEEALATGSFLQAFKNRLAVLRRLIGDGDRGLALLDAAARIRYEFARPA